MPCPCQSPQNLFHQRVNFPQFFFQHRAHHAAQFADAGDFARAAAGEPFVHLGAAFYAEFYEPPVRWISRVEFGDRCNIEDLLVNVRMCFLVTTAQRR